MTIKMTYQWEAVHRLVFMTAMVSAGISTSRSANMSMKMGMTNSSITATTPMAAQIRMIG